MVRLSARLLTKPGADEAGADEASGDEASGDEASADEAGADDGSAVREPWPAARRSGRA
jgi:hypothetical protein